MAIKDDIAGVKQQIGTEEQFLESIIKSEIFVKKYKKPLIVAALVLVLGFATYQGNNIAKDSKIKSTNQTYSALLADPTNKSLQDELKAKNVNLYALFAMQNADKVDLKELENLAGIDKNLKDIITARSGEGVLLEEYGYLLKGYEELKKGNIQGAGVEFSKISPTSPLNNIAQNLKHFNG